MINVFLSNVFIGFLRILINALSMTILQWTPVPPSMMTTARTITETFTNQQSLRIQPSKHPAVNVWSKITFINVYLQTFFYLDTNAPTFTKLRYFTGRLQYLTTAASPAPIQLSKLIQSLRKLSLMISARLLKHKSVENYQV